MREEGVVISNNRYWHILANFCDATMRTKLEAINGIEDLGEVKIWEAIEAIYQTSNPGYIRRHKCYGLKKIKGEMTSEYSDRLKLEFVESDMVNATAWSFYEYKVIDTLNSDIPDEKELKTRLLQELKKNPNPDIKACEGFIKIIREHEAVVNSRGYKEDVGENTVKHVKPEGAAADQQRPPHKLCGKTHGKGQCKYKCGECGKPHKDEDCFILHPSKRPPNWRTPEKKKNGRSRERERDRRTGRDDRSQTRSGDRRGETSKNSRRQQSPHQSRDRVERVQKRDRRTVSEDDSDQDRKELEKQVERCEKLQEKIDKKNGSTTRRIRTEIFGEGRSEGNYMDLQRDWTRDNARPSRESRDRHRTVRRVKSDACSPPTRRAPGVRPRESSGWGATTKILLSEKSDKSKKL